MHRTARRVQERLAQRGLQVEVRELPDSTRTAAEAAAAIGCEVGQIIKSLVFVSGGVGSTESPDSGGAGSAGAGAGTAEPVIVLCAGDRQVDARRLGLARADADAAREATGFAVGGIPPLGHDRDLGTIVDESLRRFAVVWAAAGTGHAVFSVGVEALIAAIPSAEIVAVSS